MIDMNVRDFEMECLVQKIEYLEKQNKMLDAKLDSFMAQFLIREYVIGKNMIQHPAWFDNPDMRGFLNWLAMVRDARWIRDVDRQEA